MDTRSTDGSEGGVRKITMPLTDGVIRGLSVGDFVSLTGVLYTARDAAHKRLTEMLERGEELPFSLPGSAVYYAGPSPARPGAVIGSIGPTTSGRMDAYSPALISRGLKVMIGKGRRGDAVRRAIAEHCGLYLVAVGGAAALISRSVSGAAVIAFHDLGTEAIRRLEVGGFRAVVAIDSRGRDIYSRLP
ncbi:MAG: FumA C-terminus/TtdB family hydratase beta subunit [Synergistaceae bacterium]|jgi:fumarate hydratase subunit beta|nr:FumA C-terminus/TtdB family hydratase beta subunit [Synergistaceae bacterium]